jgi:hypothetical protein
MLSESTSGSERLRPCHIWLLAELNGDLSTEVHPQSAVVLYGSRMLNNGCQCLLCGVSLPLRMREHAEIDSPVACLMLDRGTATRAGRTSASYRPRVHDWSSPLVRQASSSRSRADSEADRLAAAVGELVGSVPAARMAPNDAFAALTRSAAILLRVTGQHVGQSCRDLPVSSTPHVRQLRAGVVAATGFRFAPRSPRTWRAAVLPRLRGVARPMRPGLLPARRCAAFSAGFASRRWVAGSSKVRSNA